VFSDTNNKVIQFKITLHTIFTVYSALLKIVFTIKDFSKLFSQDQ